MEHRIHIIATFLHPMSCKDPVKNCKKPKLQLKIEFNNNDNKNNNRDMATKRETESLEIAAQNNAIRTKSIIHKRIANVVNAVIKTKRLIT